MARHQRMSLASLVGGGVPPKPDAFAQVPAVRPPVLEDHGDPFDVLILKLEHLDGYMLREKVVPLAALVVLSINLQFAVGCFGGPGGDAQVTVVRRAVCDEPAGLEHPAADRHWLGVPVGALEFSLVLNHFGVSILQLAGLEDNILNLGVESVLPLCLPGLASPGAVVQRAGLENPAAECHWSCWPVELLGFRIPNGGGVSPKPGGDARVHCCWQELPLARFQHMPLAPIVAGRSGRWRGLSACHHLASALRAGTRR